MYIDDLEALLEECMLSLNAIIDDGSIEEVIHEILRTGFLTYCTNVIHRICNDCFLNC